MIALHFTINDIGCAETSVDTRMIGEIETGIKAMQKGDVQELIEANAGGPYGSEVLKGVQADSDRVWNDIISDGEGSSDVEEMLEVGADGRLADLLPSMQTMLAAPAH